MSGFAAKLERTGLGARALPQIHSPLHGVWAMKVKLRGDVLCTWFGVSPFYTDAAEKWAHLGYRVVAVDLYGGRRAATHEQAGLLLGQLRDDLAARELDSAIKLAADGGRKVAAMGFSMGAKHALSAALRSPF